MTFQKKQTPEQAFQKIRHFCAYQERTHLEVKEKLYGFGLRQSDVESLISRLIEENFLNEERFAIAFAGGRFRIKKWGRVKIRYELRLKRVSAYNIENALGSIAADDYYRTLEKLARTKLESMKKLTDTESVKMAKVNTYLLQKGFEPVLIKQVMRDLRSE
jgi:regulatory protein